jgi:peptidyl-dipeptidase Dcp
VEPFLTYSARRNLRERVWRTYYSRGDNGDEYDNKPLISRILELRAERSRLHGYTDVRRPSSGETGREVPRAAMDLMMKVWPAALTQVREEVRAMQTIANQEAGKRHDRALGLSLLHRKSSRSEIRPCR